MEKINNRILGIIFVFIFFNLFIQVVSASDVDTANLNTNGSLNPNEYYIETFTINNNSELSDQKSSDSNLIFIDISERLLDFESEGNLSLYFMNASEMASFISSSTFVSKHSEINKTKYNQLIVYDDLISDFGFEPKFKSANENEENNEDLEVINVYIIIINECSDTFRFSIRYNYTNPLIEFIDEAFANILYLTFFGLGIRLFIDGSTKNREEKFQSQLLRSYGIGLIFGGIATFLWEIYHWYEILNPKNNWLQILKYDGDLGILGSNLLTFVTILSLGFSIMFISNAAEKYVQNRKMPYMTLSLLIMEILICIILFIPSIISYVIYIWMVVLFITSMNALIAYIKVIKETSGLVRKKSIVILIGLSLTYLSLVFRNFVLPDVLMNVPATIFALIMYYGLKME